MVHKELGKKLSDDDTLASVGVREGDTIRLVPDFSAGGGFFVGNFHHIQAIHAYLSKSFPGLPGYSRALFAIFLYTSADKPLAEYIRANFLELHHWSGHRLFFFVFEQPKPEYMDAAQQELAQILGTRNPDYSQLKNRLSAIQYDPLTNPKAIREIIDTFKLNHSQLPCILFFSDFKGHEVLTVPFDRLLGGPIGAVPDDDFTTMFRSLFDAIDRVTEKYERTEYFSALEREIGPGPVGVPRRYPVWSTIAKVLLEATIEGAIAYSVARLLMIAG